MAVFCKSACCSPNRRSSWISPLDGPRVSAWLLQTLHKINLDFVGHHEKWIRQPGIRGNDCAIFEHRTICRSLQLLCSYG